MRLIETSGSRVGFTDASWTNHAMTDRSTPVFKPPPPVRRRWHRRRLVMIPLILIILVGSCTGVLAWQLNRRFDAIQKISTPEPLVSGDRFGGDADLEIDTGPAQSALREPGTRRLP